MEGGGRWERGNIIMAIIVEDGWREGGREGGRERGKGGNVRGGEGGKLGRVGRRREGREGRREGE